MDKIILDAASGGAFFDKTPTVVKSLIGTCHSTPNSSQLETIMWSKLKA